MSRSSRRASAFAVAAALVGAGLAVSSPAGAVGIQLVLPDGVDFTNAGTLVEPDVTIEVDCAQVPSEDEYLGLAVFPNAKFPIPLGTTVTVQTENCTSARLMTYFVEETRATATYTPVGGPLNGQPQVQGADWTNGDVVELNTNEFELGPNTSFTVFEDGAEPGVFSISTPLAVTVADPPGDLIDDITLLIPDDATADLVVTDDPQYYDSDGDLVLGGIEGCDIAEGNHFYGAGEVVINERGIYTFRIADLDPISQDLSFLEPSLYLEDPFLALYSTFDPAEGHRGVIGCNDDAELDEFSDYNITSSGTLIGSEYSQFTVELSPGTYTLVLTSFDDESDFIISSAPTSASDGAVDPQSAYSPMALGVNETALIEVWFAPGQLAATGPSPVNAGMLAAGLGLMTLGALVFATRRRWSRA